jgi:hypothetical protein
MVFRHVLAELCEMFAVTLIMTDWLVEKDLLHGLNGLQTSILWIFTREDT